MLMHAIQVNIVCIMSQSSQYTGLGDTDVLPTDAAETVSSPTSIPLDYQELQLVLIALQHFLKNCMEKNMPCYMQFVISLH